MSQESRIPRLIAYLEHVEGRSVFTMSREEWLGLRGNEGSPVQIDVTRTPVGGVAQSASVVGAFAINYSTSPNQIHLFRYDPADSPTPYNLDKYSVWEDLSAHLTYPKILQSASIDDSEELQSYLRNHVFIVQEKRGDDHWLPTLPASAIAIMKRA